MSLSQEEIAAAAYLAGMIDGEGHVSKGLPRGNRRVEIVNTDPDLLAAAGDCCNLLGIEWRVGWRTYARGTKPCGSLVITGRRNLELLAEHVPLRSTKKRERLVFLLESYEGVEGRRYIGGRREKGKLTMDVARVIRYRHAHGETQCALASEFGVHKTTVSAVITGRAWKEIPE